jgi:AcrR family transcriptional regulator
VLDAAANTFMELGFAATSVDAVCDALGVTKGFIYYYYKSKADLFFAVQRQSMVLTRQAIEPPSKSKKSPAERLQDMAYAHTILVLTRLPYLRVAAQGVEMHLVARSTASERAALDEVLRMRDANESIYSKVISEGIKLGQFRDADARIVVKPLLGALNWTSRWYHPRPSDTADDHEKIASEISKFVVRGLLF